MSRLHPSFLDLPAEIRNQIYDLSLQLKPRKKRKQHFEYARLVALRSEYPSAWLQLQQKQTNIIKLRTGLGLLGTCKQILREAAPIFYKDKVFLFLDGSVANVLSFLLWSRDIGVLRGIRQINFTVRTPMYEEGDYSKWLTCLRILAEDAPGLKELRITFSHEGRTWSTEEKLATKLKKPIELSRDKVSAIALTKIKHVETLKLRGILTKEWPALLDEHVHSDFIVKHCGFGYTIFYPEPMYVKRAKTLHVVYKRRNQVSAEMAERGSWVRSAIDGPLVKLAEEMGI